MILVFFNYYEQQGQSTCVDGSKCVLDCSHDKEDPRPSQPTICRSPEVLSGPLSKTKQGFGAEVGVQGAGRDAQSCGETVQSCLVVHKGVKTLVPFPEEPCHTVSLPLVHSEAACLCADVMAGLQSEQQSGAGAGVQTWWRMEEGGRGRGEGSGVRPRALVGLSRLHLKQAQHGWVVPKFHPPLGGQAHVLSQVVYSSCAETKGQKGKSDRW